jgi:hypothetical protein
MPATILPFHRSTLAGPDPESQASAAADSAAAPGQPPARRPATVPTSRQIAHRWAMLSHLTRHYPRPQPPDTVR